jgi:CDP-4-dehydro-6-deoxyglucose reductase
LILDKTITGEVLSFQELSGYVMQVITAQPAEKFKYTAGQYVQLLVDNDPPRPFSIANAFDSNIIEFHVRHAPDNVFTQKLIQQIKSQKTLSFTGPFGELRYQAYPKYPLLFVAAGTGLAPCKAIIEEALKDPEHAEIYLYWTVRKPADLYWNDQLVEWTKKTEKFKYIPIISSEERIDKVILKNHADFRKIHVYASGPEEMVKDIQQKFSEPPYFYSDWLS